MHDDDSKAIILARRRRFVAAALTTVGVTAAAEGCARPAQPEPCLSQPMPEAPLPEDDERPVAADDAGPSDAGGATVAVDTSDAGSATDAAGPVPEPQVCLSVVAPQGARSDAGAAGPPKKPKPQVCLSIRKDSPKGG